MGVVGEGEHDVGAGAQEVSVQPDHRVGVLQHHFGHVGAGGEIAGSLQLEQIALGADDRPRRQPFEQARSARRCSAGHWNDLLVRDGPAARSRVRR